MDNQNSFNNSRAGTIANVVKTASTASNAFSLFKLIGGGIVFIIVFIVLLFMGVPWYIVVPFILFIILMIVLQILRLKRIASAKL